MVRNSLREVFKSVSLFATENKTEAAALIVSLSACADALFGTSALTPLIATPWGAALALAGAIGVLIKNTDTTLTGTLAFGKKAGIAAGALGFLLGSLNTAPEVFITLNSIFEGTTALGTGNIVGSSIAHMLVVLGVPALLTGIGKPKDSSWKFNTAMMAGTTALFGAQLISGTFTPLFGAAMLGLGAYYLYRRIHPAPENSHDDHEHEHEHGHEHNHDHEHDHDHDETGACLFHDHYNDEEEKRALGRSKGLNAFLAAAGVAGLIAASHVIVRSGTALADSFNAGAAGGAGEAFVGAALVALGAALPEIMINIKAVRRNQADLAIGNVLGCSIVNTLVSGAMLSLSGVFNDFSLAGTPVPEAFTTATETGRLYTGFFMGTAAALTAALAASKGAVSRKMGALALTAYAGYLAASISLNGGVMPETHRHDAHEHPAIPAVTLPANAGKSPITAQPQSPSFLHADKMIKPLH